MRPPQNPSPLRLLLLFQSQWEGEAVGELERSGDVIVHREGFELLSLGGLLRTTWFDAVRYAKGLVERYRGRIDAVWSNDEQFGCLLAAVVAERLGLPGARPAAIVRAQHKLLLRETLARACPELSVLASALPCSVRDPRLGDARWIAAEVARQARPWPLFCKPVKATFSVLARRVADAAELAQHLRLPWLDRQMLSRATRPFEQLAGDCVALPCPADCPLLEEPLDGAQVNVDGYVSHGAVRLLGIVDEWMYPQTVAGARHFAGFTYPSSHPAEVQERVRAAAVAAIVAIGYDHGFFNVELFVRHDGSVKVIEVNPRSAGQFASLYREVDGFELERAAVTLAAGGDPALRPRCEPRARVAASFVFRRFDGQPGPQPSAESLAWLAATHPQARLWVETATRTELRREYRWLGSHRHAVLNLSAGDVEQLHATGDECGRRLFGVGVLPGR